MKYEVLISSMAQQEAQTNHDWWAANRSTEQAAAWYDACIQAAFSLEENPDRFTFAPENGRFPYEVRLTLASVVNQPSNRLHHPLNGSRDSPRSASGATRNRIALIARLVPRIS
jgi:hypothetical protein